MDKFKGFEQNIEKAKDRKKQEQEAEQKKLLQKTELEARRRNFVQACREVAISAESKKLPVEINLLVEKIIQPKKTVYQRGLLRTKAIEVPAVKQTLCYPGWKIGSRDQKTKIGQRYEYGSGSEDEYGNRQFDYFVLCDGSIGAVQSSTMTMKDGVNTANVEGVMTPEEVIQLPAFYGNTFEFVESCLARFIVDKNLA